MGNTTIITDPVFSQNAGPLIFGPKRYVEPALKLNEIPKTDIFLLTHNHYDHQDMTTIRRFPFKNVKVSFDNQIIEIFVDLISDWLKLYYKRLIFCQIIASKKGYFNFKSNIPIILSTFKLN